MTPEPDSKQENGKAAPPPTSTREIRVVVDSGPNANLLDTARFEHAQRIASSIAYSPLIPEHLRRNKHREFSVQEIQANVMLVVSQALLWDVHPSAIIGETYVVSGRLGYQGKLVAALINAKANLQERLSKRFEGEEGTDEFTIVVSGVFRGETEVRETRMSVGNAKTENALWRKNPRLKLWYSAVVQWAREYAPELILGIVTDDDAERMEAWDKESPKNLSPRLPTAPAKTAKPVFQAEAVPTPEKAADPKAGRTARRKATPETEPEKVESSEAPQSSTIPEPKFKVTQEKNEVAPDDEFPWENDK